MGQIELLRVGLDRSSHLGSIVTMPAGQTALPVEVSTEYSTPRVDAASAICHVPAMFFRSASYPCLSITGKRPLPTTSSDVASPIRLLGLLVGITYPDWLGRGIPPNQPALNPRNASPPDWRATAFSAGSPWSMNAKLA